MSTTLKQQRDLIRAFYGLDAELFTDGLLNQWINDGQKHVQMDLIKNGIGRENFLKTTALTSDIQNITTVSRSANVVTITTASTHGYVAGDYIIIGDLDVGTYANGEWVIASAPTTTTFTLAITGTNGTLSPTTGWCSKGYASVPSDLMNMTDAIRYVDVKFSTTAGVNNNEIYFKPASEKTIEKARLIDSIKTNANTFETPTSTQPFYWIEGNSSIGRVIHYRPANVFQARITYYALASTLSSDSDTILIGDEWRDLIRLYVKRWINEKKGDTNKVVEAIEEYKAELQRQLEEYRVNKENKEIEKQETT